MRAKMLKMYTLENEKENAMSCINVEKIKR